MGPLTAKTALLTNFPDFFDKQVLPEKDENFPFPLQMNIFLNAIFHNILLTNPNFGYPEILRINFVLNLNNINNTNGSELTK